ncbi:alpha/beta hydrolase [Actinoallomurus rhizosphaericola]|uniref:alpha/beta hydrolase n=1 Tax=Actinoallomurus rhizosphaericola TaxID=2952536 RepID=UPI0020933270|nr:alpha/beta hydrolase-fold protein [Actinoallomurus rhizosphaericola]MCO5998146.1 alpha/beta hydrolase-fold protein [Actinoallomurus rhizosphaericola]
MGLTDGPFAALLGILGLVAFAACVVLLPRVAGRGPRQVAARAGLVVGTQSIVVFAVLVAVNSSFGFFGSWADLLGTDKSRVRVVGGAAVAAPPAVAQPSLRPTSDALSRALSPKDGRLDAVVFHGLRSGVTATGYVYLPPQYTRRAYRHRRLPVVLVLTADVRGTLTRLRLPAVAAGQIAGGAVQPTVYVLMSPVGACVDVPGGQQANTFFAEDVPMAVATSYRVAQDGPGWGVIGDASGGYCAAKLALRDGDRFTAAASAASSYGAPPGDLYGDRYGRSTAIQHENDLLWTLGHRPPPPAHLLVLTAGGTGEAARRLTALVRPPTSADSLTVHGGGALPTWQRDLPAVLRWLSGRLSPEN